MDHTYNCVITFVMMLAFLLFGGYVLLEKENRYSVELSKFYRCPTEVVSFLYGRLLLEFAFAFLLLWVGIQFELKWLSYAGCGLMPLFLIVDLISERRLRKKYQDESSE